MGELVLWHCMCREWEKKWMKPSVSHAFTFSLNKAFTPLSLRFLVYKQIFYPPPKYETVPVDYICSIWFHLLCYSLLCKIMPPNTSGLCANPFFFPPDPNSCFLLVLLRKRLCWVFFFFFFFIIEAMCIKEPAEPGREFGPMRKRRLEINLLTITVLKCACFCICVSAVVQRTRFRTEKYVMSALYVLNRVRQSRPRLWSR